jgi:hypothetical protein
MQLCLAPEALLSHAFSWNSWRVPTYSYLHVCMYVCMYVCIYVYMFGTWSTFESCFLIKQLTRAHVFISSCMYVCMYACMYVSMYTCMAPEALLSHACSSNSWHLCCTAVGGDMHAYLHHTVCMYVCIHAWHDVYPRMHIFMYVCMYVCKYTFMAPEALSCPPHSSDSWSLPPFRQDSTHKQSQSRSWLYCACTHVWSCRNLFDHITRIYTGCLAIIHTVHARGWNRLL